MPADHVCRKIDHISKLAAEYGFKSWKTLWDANKSKVKRDDPNVLYKNPKGPYLSDVLSIPEKTTSPASGATDKHHKFQLPDAPLMLRIRLLKDDYSPLKEAAYELTVEGITDPFKGKTDDKGQIEVQIKPDSVKASLSIRVKGEDSDTPPLSGSQAAPPPGGNRGEVPITWELQIGALNPIREKAPDDKCVSGVQQRLNNLGLNTGPIDGILGPNTKAAIKAFQAMYKIDKPESEKGVPDQAQTQAKLHEVHDSTGPSPKPTA